jgi:hypothetical protein
MFVMAAKRMKPMPTDYRISARTLRAVWDAMVESVREFADDRRVLFRGRKLGNEAYINAAVWHFAEMPLEDQEAILREYLPRLEGHLATAGGLDALPSVDAEAVTTPDAIPLRPPLKPRVGESLDQETGESKPKPARGRRKGSG